ncbi:unnamed protein product [Clavelina lepadiformis]|uniref:Uncharacterized protein n=1 Tax=Clavelina lepadiformis TaxID=159417 RepID=A0ABP0FCM4_CLALP
MKVAADRGCSGIGDSIPNLLMLEHTQGCNPSNPVYLLKNDPPTSFDPSALHKGFPCQEHHLTTT